jgi:plastocyanin
MARCGIRSTWALLVLVPVAALSLAGCGKTNNLPAATGLPATTAAPTTTTTVQAPTNVQVAAGLNDPDDPNVAVLQFMPAEVTVVAGAPVQWVWGGTEPHSVTFLPPGQSLPDPGSDTKLFAPAPASGPYDGTTLVNSGLQPLGPSAPKPFDLSFSTIGDHTYYCVIHPQMVGTVHVVAAGQPADTADAVFAKRSKDAATYLAEGRAAKAKLTGATPASKKNADGSTTWTVQMGASTAHTDVLAFAPTPAKAKAGDTVTFVNDSAAPHTASFFGTGSTPITNPLDPRTDAPAPGPSPQALSGSGFFNTGLLPPNAPGGKGPPESARSFSFTVPTAGTYGYVCILHSSSGMTGSISVS